MDGSGMRGWCQVSSAVRGLPDTPVNSMSAQNASGACEIGVVTQRRPAPASSLTSFLSLREIGGRFRQAVFDQAVASEMNTKFFVTKQHQKSR